MALKTGRKGSIHRRATSRDTLRKNFCPSCQQFRDVPKRIKNIENHSRLEYDKISHRPDCGSTLARENKFIDLGGG